MRGQDLRLSDTHRRSTGVDAQPDWPTRDEAVRVPVEGSEDGVGSRLVLNVPPSTTHLRFVRERLDEWLQSIGVLDDRWPLVVTELVTNAIEAVDGEGDIDVACELVGERVMIAVANDGVVDTSEVVESTMPRATARRGRGLALVQALTSDFHMSVERGRTVVRCSHLAPIDSAPRRTFG